MLTRHQQAILDNLSASLSERVSTPRTRRGYSAEAAGVARREIDKDRRIKPSEARLIHALLKGRH